MDTDALEQFTSVLYKTTVQYGNALRAARTHPVLGLVVTYGSYPRVEKTISSITSAALQVGVGVSRLDLSYPPYYPDSLQPVVPDTHNRDEAWLTRAGAALAVPDLTGQATEIAASLDATVIARDGGGIAGDITPRDPRLLTPKALAAAVNRLAVDDAVHGVFCPPPLPADLSVDDLPLLIPLPKDVGATRQHTSALVPYSLTNDPNVTLTHLIADPNVLPPYRWAAIALLLYATARAAILQYNAGPDRTEPLDLNAAAPVDDDHPFVPRAFGPGAAPDCGRCFDTGRFSEGRIASAHCNCKRGRRMSEEWYREAHGADYIDEH